MGCLGALLFQNPLLKLGFFRLPRPASRSQAALMTRTQFNLVFMYLLENGKTLMSFSLVSSDALWHGKHGYTIHEQ